MRNARELAFLGDGWTPQVRDRRLSDSMLSVRPKEDEGELWMFSFCTFNNWNEGLLYIVSDLKAIGMVSASFLLRSKKRSSKLDQTNLFISYFGDDSNGKYLKFRPYSAGFRFIICDPLTWDKTSAIKGYDFSGIVLRRKSPTPMRMLCHQWKII